MKTLLSFYPVLIFPLFDLLCILECSLHKSARFLLLLTARFGNRGHAAETLDTFLLRTLSAISPSLLPFDTIPFLFLCSLGTLSLYIALPLSSGSSDDSGACTCS